MGVRGGGGRHWSAYEQRKDRDRGDLGKGTRFKTPRLHCYTADAQKRDMAKVDTMGVRGGGGRHWSAYGQRKDGNRGRGDEGRERGR